MKLKLEKSDFSEFIREVAEKSEITEIICTYYGEPDRHMKWSCPFHNEKTPSFSVKSNRFKCFGCQKSGDSVKFVSEYFNISAYQAALKINQDFGLNLRPPTDTKEKPAPEPKERPLTEREKQVQIDEWAFTQHDILLDYFRLLKEYSQEFPKDNEINWKFSAFLDDFGTVEFLLESLIDKHKRHSMYDNWQPTVERMIKNFKENIKREAKENANKSNNSVITGNGSSRTSTRLTATASTEKH